MADEAKPEVAAEAPVAKTAPASTAAAPATDAPAAAAVPATDAPATDAPAADKPAADKPAADEPKANTEGAAAAAAATTAAAATAATAAAAAATTKTATPTSKPLTAGAPAFVPAADLAMRNVIVNLLPSTMSENDLRKHFSQFGPVESVKLILNKNTGESMKYAFVVYEQKESVITAIKETNKGQTGTLRAAYAGAPGQHKGMEGKADTIYVSGFEQALDEAGLQETFGKYGSIQDVRLMDSSKGPQKYGKGVAFIKYGSIGEAESAIVHVHGRLLEGCSKPLLVKYATPPTKKSNASPVMDPMAIVCPFSPNTRGSRGDRRSPVPPCSPTHTHTHIHTRAHTRTQAFAVARQSALQAAAEMQHYLKRLEMEGRAQELYSLVAVSNLPTDTTEMLLWSLFGQFGAIESLVMPTHVTGMCKGTAWKLVSKLHPTNCPTHTHTHIHRLRLCALPHRAVRVRGGTGSRRLHPRQQPASDHLLCPPQLRAPRREPGMPFAQRTNSTLCFRHAG